MTSDPRLHCAQGTVSGTGTTFALCRQQVAVVGEVARSGLATQLIEIVQNSIGEMESVVDILLQSNQMIYELVNVDPPEMRAASLVVATSRGNHVVVAHTGGCQAWLFRDREVYRLSSDQSLAMDVLMNTGSFDQYDQLRREAPTAISAALGLMPVTRLDVRYEPIRSRDRVVLLAGGATLGRLGYGDLVEAAKYDNPSQVVGILRRRATSEDWAAAVLAF